jgi:uncharacterized protein YhaN
MKIQKLDLKKFGPFSDRVLDFAPNSLNLIFGRNEAGKSSSLRALRQLFYGIPVKTTDDFVHAGKDLRLGGELMHSDGSTLGIMRRRGRAQALRDYNDKEVLDESVLHKFLGGLAQSHFESLFGIDHAALIAGGQALFGGKGELGQILFSAGSGVGDINRVSDKLNQRCEEYFKPLGSNQIINAGIKNLQLIQARIKSVEVSAGQWEALDEALNKARKQKATLEDSISQKQQAQGKLQRIKDALPLLAKRKSLQMALDTLKAEDAIALPEDFGQKAKTLQLEKARLTSENEQLELGLKQLAVDLDNMQIPSGLLDRAPGIEDLQQKLGSHLKAMDDTTNMVVRLTEHENVMKTALKDLGHKPDLELCENLRITVGEKVRIRELESNKKAVESKAEAAKGRVASIAKTLESIRAELGKLAQVAESEALVKAVKRVEQKGTIEQQLKQARLREGQAIEQMKVFLGKLQISESETLLEIAKTSAWDKLEALPVPGSETVERFAKDINTRVALFEKLQNFVGDIDKDLRDVAQALEQLRHEMDTPTEVDLSTARVGRDRDWQSVKEAWKKAVYAEGQNGELTQSFEAGLKEADTIADRLRRESAQIAKRATLLAEQQKLNGKRDETTERLAKGDEQLALINASWLEAWSSVAIKPLPPSEMRGWLSTYNEAIRQIKVVKEASAAVVELDEQVEQAKVELSALLKNSEDAGLAGEVKATLAALLEACQGLVTRAENVRNERLSLNRDLERQKTELAKAEEELSTASSAQADWTSEWSQAIRPLKLEGPVSPSQASAMIDTLDKLFNAQTQAQNFSTRLKGIERDATIFSDEVAEICAAVAPDLAAQPAEQAAGGLYKRLKDARANKERLEVLTRQREEKSESLKQGKGRLQQCLEELNLMYQQARCADYEGLAAAAEKSKSLREGRVSLSEVEEGLLALCGGAGLEVFLADVEAVDTDKIAPDLVQLSEEIAGLSTFRGEEEQSIGSLQAELKRIDGGGAAAEAADEAQALITKIGSASEEYARVHIARVLLKQCVARYREKNQSPVLKRASVIFEELTLGSFIALREDYNDKGEPVLVGVRPDEKLVGLSAMSEGTCDQAYLALRLASLELHIENNEPLPFIVDDILVNFDDERSHAALKVLTALSNHTQVIFFTHNAHLVDLAKDKLDKDRLHIHDLNKAKPIGLRS